MSTITIDGREIPFEAGDTIIRAASRAGVEIPHYCWHPGLSIAANCRMCLVEIVPPAGQRGIQLDILKWDAEKKDYVPARKPKLQPACQATCAPGMEVKSDSSDHVVEARAAVQELLLLNHPVDCPICDQAGECRLQDYWLEHGRNKKQMRQETIHKPKAVSFGPTIVYDAERCIVCTRCVRFCEEVVKDPVLNVRERGNLNEITVSPGRELDHNYTLMTEHVCPVGALTAKDFRFKARVWFLRSANTICQGCATGCNAFLDYDPRTNTAHRHRPRENAAVNQYWMCDEGMLSYQRIAEGRLEKPTAGSDVSVGLTQALDAAAQSLQGVKSNPASSAIVLSAQHSQEDNLALLELARFIGTTAIYVTGRSPGKGDAVLMHADKNPNRAGVEQLLASRGLKAKPLADLIDSAAAGQLKGVIALGSEHDADATRLATALRGVSVVVLATHKAAWTQLATVALPVCTWAESEGTFVNAKGLAQVSELALAPKGTAEPAWVLVGKLAQGLGYAIDFKRLRDVRKLMPSSGSTPTGGAAVSGSAQKEASL
jgi:NADH-quinone oxidoreductase subunit G